MVPSPADWIAHKRPVFRRIRVECINSTESEVIRDRLADERGGGSGPCPADGAGAMSITYHRKDLPPNPDAQADWDTFRRALLRGPGAAHQENVAAVFARREVGLLVRRRESGLAGEGVGHNERQLLLMQRHFLARSRQS